MVSILSMSWTFKVKKSSFYGNKIILKKLKTENISILKLKISNHNKAHIPWTNFTEALKNHSSLWNLIKTAFCRTCLIPEKWSEIHVDKSSYHVYCRAGNFNMLRLNFFIPLQHRIEVSTLARLTFYENLFFGQETTLSVLRGVHIKWVDLGKM